MDFTPMKPPEAPKAMVGGRKLVTVTVAILAIAASIASIIYTQMSHTPKVDGRHYIAIGQVMAEETARVLEDKGEILLICNATAPKGSIMDQQMTTFKETLGKRGGISIKATQTLEAGVEARAGPDMGLSHDAFLKLLEANPGISGIVSFVGLPMLQDADIAKLGTERPKIVVYSQMGMGMKKLLETNAIDVAIMPRMLVAPPSPTSKPSTKKPVTLRECFDLYYQIFTSENASSLRF